MPRILYLKEMTCTLLFPLILYMYLLISLEQNKLKVVTDKQSDVLADEQTDRWIDK